MLITVDEIFEVTWLGLDNPDAPNGAPDHFYRHFPSGPAPIILEKWIESYRYLNYVPTFLNSGWWFGADGEYGGGDKVCHRRYLYVYSELTLYLSV